VGVLAFIVTFAMYGSVAQAQQPTKIPRIGYVAAGGEPNNPGSLVEAFRQGLRELGYIEEKNIFVEFRYGEGKAELALNLVAELVQLKVDALIVTSLPTIRAAKQATKTIPIVMVTVQDPVETGIVDSLASPGREYHGSHQSQPRVERETAGIAEGDSSGTVARRSPLGCERTGVDDWF
jgi:putative tryptophan/tyrosine transport system substrate-binding protein